MRRLLIVAVLALLPGQAFASTCMSITVPGEDGSPLVIDMVAAGGFFTVVGEIIVQCGSGYFPVHGGGHLRPDGKLHFAVMVPEMSVAAPGCMPFWIVATVDPPSFNTGSGVTQSLSGFSSPVTITPTTCPPLPE